MKLPPEIIQDLSEYWTAYADHCHKAGWAEVQRGYFYIYDRERTRYRRIVDLAEKYGAGGRCLELGACEGMMTEDLAKFCSHVDAVEISAPFLTRAPELDNVTYIHADCERAFYKAQYKVIVASEILEHINDPETLVAALLPRCSFLIAAVPINEPLNLVGAFDPAGIGATSGSQGWGGGHISSWTEDEFLQSLNTEIIEKCNLEGVDLIAVARGRL